MANEKPSEPSEPSIYWKGQQAFCKQILSTGEVILWKARFMGTSPFVQWEVSDAE